MGFSWIGLAVGLAVLAPNLLLIRFPPVEGMPAFRPPAALSWLERAGQALCLVVPAITEPGEFTIGWAAVSGAALLGYYGLWARYLRSGRRVATLYRSLWILPLPMAILPVVVFLATAAWLGNPWIAVAALILAAGHVPVALLTRRAVADPA
ncbi:hypothetical protein [Microbacterium tumbae]